MIPSWILVIYHDRFWLHTLILITFSDFSAPIGHAWGSLPRKKNRLSWGAGYVQNYRMARLPATPMVNAPKYVSLFAGEGIASTTTGIYRIITYYYIDWVIHVCTVSNLIQNLLGEVCILASGCRSILWIHVIMILLRPGFWRIPLETIVQHIRMNVHVHVHVHVHVYVYVYVYVAYVCIYI